MTSCEFGMILPTQLGAGNLGSTNLPADSIPEWPKNSGDQRNPQPNVPYVAELGAESVWQNGVWECVEPGAYSSSDSPGSISPNQSIWDPAEGVFKPLEPAVFIRARSTNQWAALNSEQGNRTVSASGEIQYTLWMDSPFSAVSLVHMTHVESATITVGEHTVTQAYPDPNTSPWFVHDLVLNTGTVVAGGYVTVTVRGTPGKLSLGSLTVGRAYSYGVLLSPLQRRGKNPGTAVVDDYGYTSFRQRYTSKLLDVTFEVQPDMIDNLERTLHLALATPAVYLLPSIDIPIVRYCKLNDFTITENSGYCEADVQIESLMDSAV